MRKLTAVVLLFFSVSILEAQDPMSHMEEVVNHYADNKKFMGSVLIARDGKMLLEKGYGFANLEWDVPNAPTTKVRLGSITKQFTAACILMLEERGKLRVDDPVKKYIPDAPSAWDKVTIYNLLTHTSGIPSFTSFPDYPSTKMMASPVEKTVLRFRDKPLDFQPGEKWAYSNSGYILLGYLIEKISGQSYEKFLRDERFRLRFAGCYNRAPHVRLCAARRHRGQCRLHRHDHTFFGWRPVTTEDLLRWEQGLFGGALLSAASLRKMITPFLHDYACGLGVRSMHNHKVIDHGGGIEGFNTFLAYYPEGKMGVAALANLNGMAPESIALQSAAIAHGAKVTLPSERKEISVSPSILESYVGTYELQPGFNLNVTLEGGNS